MPLEVHVWSDVACPWCYVGEKRLAVAARAKGVELDLIWHSFELDPRPVTQRKGGDYVERLAAKYGRTRPQAQAMIDNMNRIGAEEGVQFDFEAAIFANTFDAHRLLQWARAEHPESQNALATALFEAHLCQGRDLNDGAALVAIAFGVGLDEDAASAVVFSETFAQEVRDDEKLAQEMGVSGVPFYVIGQYGVGGAQNPETFEKVLQRALDDAPSTQHLNAEEGKFCSPEGC